MTISFSYSDYRSYMPINNPLNNRKFFPFGVFAYKNLDINSHEIKRDLKRSLEELQKRTSREYYYQVSKSEFVSLENLHRLIPMFRVILPNIIISDWLSLVTWNKQKRDHTLHQSLTAYIITKLFDENENFLPNNERLIDKCLEVLIKLLDNDGFLKSFLDHNYPEQWHLKDFFLDISRSKEIWKRIFKEMAYLSAILHDIGYSFQFTNIIRDSSYDPINFFEKPYNYSKQIIQGYSSYLLFYPFFQYNLPPKFLNSYSQKYLEDIIDEGLEKTHGFPGSLIFLHLFDKTKSNPLQKNHPIIELSIQWIAMAIMMHDMKKIYWGKKSNGISPDRGTIQLKFENDPLSSILALADVIQDFNRPSVLFENKSNRSIIKYQASSEKAELILNNRELSITYHCRSEEYLKKKRDIKGDNHDYFENGLGYLNLSYLGIDSVKLDVQII